MAVTKPLMGTKVTPSQVTWVRLATGLAAAGAFAAGQDPWWTVGGVLFLVSMVLDRGDGDYARLSGQTSAAGHKFDLVADAVCNAVIFVGLGVGLRDGSHGLLAVPMGIAAGLAVTAVLWMVMRMESLAGQRSAEIGNLFGFDPDDAMMLIPILVFFGLQEPLLLAAVVGAPAFALAFFVGWLVKVRRVRGGAAEGGPERG